MDVWKDLSTRELQAYGALCLHRFCKAKGIQHDSIDKLTDHLLLMLITSPLADWEGRGAKLELNGRGWDPIPASLNDQVPEQIRDDFANLVEDVVSIGFCDMYGAATRGPLKYLVKCLTILDAHGIERPDVAEVFKARTPRGDTAPAWGETYSPERYEQVRALFRQAYPRTPINNAAPSMCRSRHRRSILAFVRGIQQAMCVNPYDELPYRSFPIEWTAPERLAVASLLHGGPRPPVENYRVLDLGCGNGANVLRLAYYRRQATFVGVDGAASQIEVANVRKAALGLSNIEFIHTDFCEASQRLSGQFDYILAHGIFSWVSLEARDALLKLFAARLRPGGLLYLNYNTRPGWNVRGLVREFLIAQTAGERSLRARAELAKQIAAKVMAALTGVEHHYSQLLSNEFRFVAEGDDSWVGHEFLAENNLPYWRSDFLALARHYHLQYVADADFNYSSGRVPEELMPRLNIAQITGRSLEDTVDLLCYRQLHSPILTPAPWRRELPGIAEFADLFVASCLELTPPRPTALHPIFKHPSGYEVEAKEDFMQSALTRLQAVWPRGLRVRETFTDVQQVEEDLKLLHRNGLIELRCIEPGDCGVEGGVLNRLERDWGNYYTTPYHTSVEI